MLYHIVAMAENRVIGKDNRLPWHFPEDLKRFKQLTIGNTLIMGRKTYESIGKPLPGRENFVVSHSTFENKEHLKFFKSVEDALNAVRTEKTFIIGGAEIFRQTINSVDGIYLTLVKNRYEGDAFYPEIPAKLHQKERVASQENPKLEFVTYERK